jgi:uncharacterized BrkB/YihY/UPF0761 family membrane protein
MFWIYLSSFILFYGAHLVNAINYSIANRKSAAELLDFENIDTRTQL